MYIFLSQISLNTTTKRLTNLQDLEQMVKTLEQNEEKFWSLFVKNFGHKREKPSFQYNNNEQTITFWWTLGETNTELIDIFFGTKIRWIRKLDAMEIKSTVHKSHLDVLADSIKKDVEKGKLWRVPESFPHVLLSIFMVEQNEPDGTKKYRRILNCVPINDMVPNHKFEFPTPELAVNLFSKFVISIDLKRACFQKNLTYSDRKYFCFRCPKTNKCFCYTSLPFGPTNVP